MMKPGMRAIVEQWIVASILVRAVMWVSGVDLFTRGEDAGIAIGVSLTVGAVLTGIYNAIASEIK